MSHVATVLGNWLSEFASEPELYTAAYHDDINVLALYLERVYGFHNSRLVLTGAGHADAILETIAVLQDVLYFPVWSGLDPNDPETAAWAVFTARRGVEIHPDIYSFYGRFAKNSSAKKLIDAGVPFPYVKGLDIMHWGEEYPAEKVIVSWQARLTPEYARVVVFGEAVA